MVGETIQVTFENCHQGQWDWIGMYQEIVGQELDLNANLQYWLYSCGNDIGPCRPAATNGVMPFVAEVPEGTYSFQLVEGVMPYVGMASSQSFRVAAECVAIDGSDAVEYDEAAIEGGPTDIPDEIFEEPGTEEPTEDEDEDDEDKDAEWMD